MNEQNTSTSRQQEVEALFSQAIPRLREPLYRFLFSMLHNREAAEDAVQESLLKVYLTLLKQGNVQEQSFGGLFFVTARRTAIDMLRSKHWHTLPFSLLSECDNEEEGQDHWEERIFLGNEENPAEAALMRSETLQAVLGSLSEQDTLSFWLVAAGYRQREIAAMQGITIPAVKKRLMRAREKLVALGLL